MTTTVDSTRENDMFKLVFAACIALALGPAIGVAHAASADCPTLSSRLLDHLDKGDFTGATADFDDRMRSGLSADALANVWQSLPQKFGARGAREPARSSVTNGSAVVVTPLHYGDKLIDAQVACSADGRIAGFYIRPHH